MGLLKLSVRAWQEPRRPASLFGQQAYVQPGEEDSCGQLKDTDNVSSGSRLGRQ